MVPRYKRSKAKPKVLDSFILPLIPQSALSKKAPWFSSRAAAFIVEKPTKPKPKKLYADCAKTVVEANKINKARIIKVLFIF